MRIGYTILGHHEVERDRLTEEGRCDELVALTEVTTPVDSFLSCLKQHKQHHIVVVNIESIGLQINQYIPIYEYIINHDINLQFIEKETNSDRGYLTWLYQLARQEKLIVSHRTHVGLELAKQAGRKGGRPKIDASKIAEIHHLFYDKKRTLREISEISGVSLGTVHKYVKTTH